MPSHVDVLVVGAGPTGSNTARLLAERGWSVLLVEEHPEVGRPVQCAGLVTPRIFDHLPFDIGDLWQNDLRGGIIVAPGGRRLRFESEHVQAQAMDRARFDQRVADAATDAGVELRTATKAIAATQHEAGVQVTLRSPEGDEKVTCRLLVGADGIRSRVAEWFGFPRVREIVSAYEAELSGCTIPEGEEHLIPMFTGDANAPGFFSWIIPVGGDRTRSGLAVAPGLSEAAAKRYYERMFDHAASGPYLHGAQEEHLIIGGIPLGIRPHLVKDRVMLVGDAAGMAKPTSGGGIFMGLVGSELLAKTADRALQTDLIDETALKPYERAVRRSIAKELRTGNILRAIYVRLRDADLDRFAALLDQPRIRRIIERRGDIDYPSRLLVPAFLAEPRLPLLFAKVLLRRKPS